MWLFISLSFELLFSLFYIYLVCNFIAFCHASPTVWNSLHQTVIFDLTVTTGIFKNRLQSALYGRAFLQSLVTCPHLRFFTIVNDLTCV